MSAVDDDDDDDNDNDKGIVKNTRWISTFMNAVDSDDDDNDNDKGIVRNTRWIATFMNAVDDHDDDDNENDQGIVKNTMWISTFMNAVDDDDDDDDMMMMIMTMMKELLKTPCEYRHLWMQSMIMKIMMTVIKPSWGDQNRQKAMDCLHKSTFGIKV